MIEVFGIYQQKIYWILSIQKKLLFTPYAKKFKKPSLDGLGNVRSRSRKRRHSRNCDHCY